MSGELVPVQAGGIVATRDYSSREVIDTIKQTVARGATDAQLMMFLEVCKRTGLDPFLKEVWFVPNVGVMAGRDGYLRVANENPAFDGMDTHVIRENGKILKAVCSVYRKDRAHPITCEAYFNEYNKPNSNVWRQYPSAMISKVAEVLALKRSFSINGVVTEEEIGNEAQPTRQEAIGAAKAVAEAKIEALKRGEQLPAEDPKVLTPEVVPPDPEPPAKPENWFKKMVGNFEAMKNTLGRETYYRILGANGYTHANEFPNRDEAMRVYKEMLAEHVRLSKPTGPQPDGTLTVDQPTLIPDQAPVHPDVAKLRRKQGSKL